MLTNKNKIIYLLNNYIPFDKNEKKSKDLILNFINKQENSKNSEDNFIDFYIQACWPPPFEGPNARTGTIVRLYE